MSMHVQFASSVIVDGCSQTVVQKREKLRTACLSTPEDQLQKWGRGDAVEVPARVRRCVGAQVCSNVSVPPPPNRVCRWADGPSCV